MVPLNTFTKVLLPANETRNAFHIEGPHPDASKSKELQDQGKKINLSLSEMAQVMLLMLAPI